ncbi:glycoside hydrolase family 88 protein [Candidatus Neomarinimicrobiota bacterium]
MSRSILLITIVSAVAVFLFTSCGRSKSDAIIKSVEKQLLAKDDIFQRAGKFPEYTVNGRWNFAQGERPNWFAGFTGGELWQMYEITGNDELQDRALSHADHLLSHTDLDNTHDMGFIFMPTCVEAYEKTGKQKYRVAGIKAAQMLAKRYNRIGRFIRAWGRLGTDQREGWMIIDTMMNLELLFWAAQETGADSLYQIALAHAETARKEIVRDNYSSYHVIEWEPGTGELIEKRTRQGYANESTWARGQAWGIYGFANTYRRTGKLEFLQTSLGMADYFIGYLPEDQIPYWDLDLSGGDVYRDASAGAIAASGMYLLADLVDDDELRVKYSNQADAMVTSLIEKYLYTSSSRAREEGILIHTVYHFNGGRGIDESYPCGDYYFMEALRKWWDRRANDA